MSGTKVDNSNYEEMQGFTILFLSLAMVMQETHKNYD